MQTKVRPKNLAFLLFLQLVVIDSASAKPGAPEQCFYLTKSGEFKTSASRDEVPYDYRKDAKCQPLKENTRLVKPDEVTLSGNQRTERISSPLGEILLRWPRKVESLFGRTPLRAMTDAANTVSRALKNGALPSELQNLSLKWNVVFMDENMPEGQIPSSLVTNCHPGWMTPPANIYIVAQRVAGGCGSQRASASVADATLSQVLVHEIGHAVEFHLLKGRGPMERMRAEGFATWFERYASQYSGILSPREITDSHFAAAEHSFRASPTSFQFTGTFEDYSRASIYFSAITGPRGLQGLVEVYEAITNSSLPLTVAIEKVLNWDERRLTKELSETLRKKGR